MCSSRIVVLLNICLHLQDVSINNSTNNKSNNSSQSCNLKLPKKEIMNINHILCQPYINCIVYKKLPIIVM